LTSETTPTPAAVRLTARPHPLDGFDQAISDFDGVVQEMTVLFARQRWPGTVLEPWLYEDNGTPVAAALVMVQKLPAALGHLAVVKWGPILRDETAPARIAMHQAAVDHLVAEYARGRGMMLSIMAHAEREPALHAAERLWGMGFRPGSALLFPSRYLVRVRLSDADQRASYSQKWRYHLNKSEKQGLTFEPAGPEALPRFSALYDAMSERKRFPDYSAYHTLPHLMAWDSPALRPQLFFVTHQGRDVAGAVIFTAGRTAVYLYGATNEQALPLRAGYFMHARIIAWLRDECRAEWYDLGGTDGFQGLHQFKSGMVGSAGRIVPVPPIGNYAVSWRARLSGTLAYAARDGFQKLRAFRNRLLSRGLARPNQDQQP